MHAYAGDFRWFEVSDQGVVPSRMPSANDGGDRIEPRPSKEHMQLLGCSLGSHPQLFTSLFTSEVAETTLTLAYSQLTGTT